MSTLLPAFLPSCEYLATYLPTFLRVPCYLPSYLPASTLLPTFLPSCEYLVTCFPTFLQVLSLGWINSREAGGLLDESQAGGEAPWETGAFLCELTLTLTLTLTVGDRRVPMRARRRPR